MPNLTQITVLGDTENDEYKVVLVESRDDGDTHTQTITLTSNAAAGTIAERLFDTLQDTMHLADRFGVVSDGLADRAPSMPPGGLGELFAVVLGDVGAMEDDTPEADPLAGDDVPEAG